MKLWILSPSPADCTFVFLPPSIWTIFTEKMTIPWFWSTPTVVLYDEPDLLNVSLSFKIGRDLHVITTKSKDSSPSSCLPKHALRVFTCINFDSINKVSLLVGIVEKVLVYLVDKMSVWKGSVSLRPGKNTRQFENLHFVHCLVSMCSRIWKITNVQNWILIKWQFSF